MATKKKPAKEAAKPRGDTGHYVLCLYIAGMTPRSQLAIENIKRTCEEYLKECYNLKIVDIYEYPELAESAQIIAVPTLIKKLPAPLRRLVGDLSNTDHVLLGLDLCPKKSQTPEVAP